MAEIIDVLSAPLGHGAQFIVDAAVDSVDLSPVIVGLAQTLESGLGAFNFTRGDNIIILSAGYHIPESFALAQYSDAGAQTISLPNLYLAAQSAPGPSIPITSWGHNGVMRLPFPNYECSVGIFINPEELGLDDGAQFVLQSVFPSTAGLGVPQVSMINVPAALDGKTIFVTPFIKILHNIPLA